LTWFRKKEEPTLPARFGLIRVSPLAKSKAIYDNPNKIIEIYRDGVVVKSEPYSEELVTALMEVDEIPVIEETPEETNFQFNESEGFGFTEYRR